MVFSTYFDKIGDILINNRLKKPDFLKFKKEGAIEYEIKNEKKVENINSKLITMKYEKSKKSFNNIITLNIFKYSNLIGNYTFNLLLFRQLVHDSVKIAKDFLNTDVVPVLLKSLILFLQSFNHFDPIFTERLKDLIKYYFNFLEYEENIKGDLGENKELLIQEKLFAAEEYLKLCINDENQKWFNKQKDVSSREREIENIVNFINDIDMPLDNFEEEKDKVEELLRDARTWLMRRYDIDKAAEIQFGKRSFKYMAAKCLPEIVAGLLFLALRFIKIDFWQIFNYPAIDVLNLHITNYILLFLGYGGIIAFAGYVYKKINPGMNQFQILLPRVAGGIVVGYFALMTDEAWNGVFSRYVSFTLHDPKFSWLVFWGKIIIPLLFVYVYLLIEMSNVKGINDIQKKAKRILFRGYSYSIIIGVIFSDIFGNNLFNRVSENHYLPITYFKGVFGNIYPEAILLLSPLALFIGIFLQLLWEDKAVTEKI